jgi:hypothetical protein
MPLAAIETIVVAAGCFLASAAASAAVCQFIPALLRLTPLAEWRRAALIFGAVAGLILTPLSVFTFGWFGAGFGSYFKAAAPAVMLVSIPISVAFGVALASSLLGAVVFGGAAALKLTARRCPLFVRGRAAG